MHQKINEIICALIHSRNKAYMDLTGRFTYKSSRGNDYILIAYHIDANAIIEIPKKIDKHK